MYVLIVRLSLSITAKVPRGNIVKDSSGNLIYQTGKHLLARHAIYFSTMSLYSFDLGPKPTDSSVGESVGLIVGITIGGVVVVLCSLAYYKYRRSKRQQLDDDYTSLNDAERAS
jgi:hypothetical protein